MVTPHYACNQTLFIESWHLNQAYPNLLGTKGYVVVAAWHLNQPTNDSYFKSLDPLTMLPIMRNFHVPRGLIGPAPLLARKIVPNYIMSV
jgi:hypothetical protein